MSASSAFWRAAYFWRTSRSTLACAFTSESWARASAVWVLFTVVSATGFSSEKLPDSPRASPVGGAVPPWLSGRLALALSCPVLRFSELLTVLPAVPVELSASWPYCTFRLTSGRRRSRLAACTAVWASCRLLAAFSTSLRPWAARASRVSSGSGAPGTAGALAKTGGLCGSRPAGTLPSVV